MTLRKVGFINMYGDEVLTVYHNEKSFVDADGNLIKKDDFENWALVTNSPWSQANETYTIKCNCKDAYTEMDKDDYIWKCTYSIVGYDYIKGGVIGYGFTETDALENCIKLFKYIQKEYNPDNESF